MMILNKIISEIKDAKNILILPHVSSDGDALGSCIALGLALERAGKKVIIFLEEEIPVLYSFLPGKHLVKIYKGEVEQFDMVVALDTGDLERLGDRVALFKGARITANIDHHNTNSEFAFHNYVQANASAVGEIIYQVIKMMGITIETNIANCLYVAITSDTGGFRFSNTTAMTHQIIADLISNGVNVAEISQNIFDSTSLGKVKLMGAAISSLEVLEKGKIAFITVTDAIMKNCGAKEEDCDGIVNLGRNIREVEVSAMIRQRENGEIKVNLRSKKYVDVSAIAALYKGGGHKRAAGYTTNKSIDEAKKMLLQDIKETLLKQLGM